MVNGWTGGDACALQSALQMSQQEYADHLKIGLSTVSDWHKKPKMRLRPATQRLLESALADASDAAKARFAALTGQPASDGPAGTVPPTAATEEGADPRSVAIGTNTGVIVTGDAATVDARTIHLPAEAVRAPSGVTAGRGLHNLPAPPSAVFVDREDSLAQLHEAMASGLPASSPVVHGLGGSGKSTLALQFAHSNRDRYNPVWWIAADTPVSVTNGLAQLAARLDPYASLTAKNSAEAAAWAINWLQAHEGWLLVLDDATPASVQPVLGTLAGGRHLITSRRATGWHRVGRPLPLTVLPPDAALDLLMQVINPGDDADRELLQQLAGELGYLPLALEQAAAYIEYTAISPATYLDRLRHFPARTFAASADAGGEADRQRTIARVWQLSLAAIERDQPLAGEILRTLAWFAPDPIPRDLVYQLDTDAVTVDEALALLNAYSMITLTSQSVTIHRLVMAVARLSDPADPRRTPEAVSMARGRASRLLQGALPPNPLFNAVNWPRWRELLPHALALTDHIGPDEDTPATAGILVAVSAFLQTDGHNDEAVTSARRAVDACRRLHGPDTLETLTARSFLASAYRAAGDLETAGPLHELNVADSERVLGVDHRQSLNARANLAYLYAMQRREDLALELNERSLSDHERLYGPDDFTTLNARANLASSYRATGNLARAIELHERCVSDYARVLGETHAETITARSNLAYAYQLAGDLHRAIPIYRQVLSDRERIYGENHHYTEIARLLLANSDRAASERSPDGQQDEG